MKRPLPVVRTRHSEPGAGGSSDGPDDPGARGRAPGGTSRPPSPGLSRKGFVDWLLGTSVGGLALAVAYPVSRYLVPPEIPESAVGSVTLGVRAADVPVNSGQVFKFGSRPGILIRTPAGDLRAFSARCTHLDCTVQYRDDLSHIWCACHNGHFDLNGRNIAGPPPEPLEEFDVNLRGEQIVVSRRS